MTESHPSTGRKSHKKPSDSPLSTCSSRRGALPKRVGWGDTGLVLGDFRVVFYIIRRLSRSLRSSLEPSCGRRWTRNPHVFRGLLQLTAWDGTGLSRARRPENKQESAGANSHQSKAPLTAKDLPDLSPCLRLEANPANPHESNAPLTDGNWCRLIPLCFAVFLSY